MLKIWGRNTSSNVQKVMWALGELGLACERIDIAGPFGGNREPAYLALNPNGLVPTLDEDGFVLWESNTIVRYLAALHGAGTLQPEGARAQAAASQWMDWQLSVVGPAILPAYMGLIRTPPEKRDMAAIAVSQAKTTDAMRILDAELGDRPFVAGDAFCMGDIPVAIMARRYRELFTDRPDLPNLERWFAAISARPAFREHVLEVPLS